MAVGPPAHDYSAVTPKSANNRKKRLTVILVVILNDFPLF